MNRDRRRQRQDGDEMARQEKILLMREDAARVHSLAFFLTNFVSFVDDSKSAEE
jgi:hypothetical protein